jgi:hypothetical protein
VQKCGRYLINSGQTAPSGMTGSAALDPQRTFSICGLDKALDGMALPPRMAYEQERHVPLIPPYVARPKFTGSSKSQAALLALGQRKKIGAAPSAPSTLTSDSLSHRARPMRWATHYI